MAVKFVPRLLSPAQEELCMNICSDLLVTTSSWFLLNSVINIIITIIKVRFMVMTWKSRFNRHLGKSSCTNAIGGYITATLQLPSEGKHDNEQIRNPPYPAILPSTDFFSFQNCKITWKLNDLMMWKTLKCTRRRNFATFLWVLQYK